ncbi:hypothetical protein ACR56S_04535 [Staphylococcus hominis]|uniref:hypothetical protein n=1 Tax=Staphylococcus hominis TaxID=1290 RepID=UPI003DA018F7
MNNLIIAFYERSISEDEMSNFLEQNPNSEIDANSTVKQADVFDSNEAMENMFEMLRENDYEVRLISKYVVDENSGDIIK